MTLKSLLVRIFKTVVLVAASGLVAPTPASAVTGVCNADNTQICADISSLSFSSNGTNSAVASGKATATPSATQFTFRFTSNANLARKWVTVGFFDISSGIHLLPGVGDATASNACAASGVVGKSCVVQTDAAGSATFTIKIINAAVGKGFSYLMSGPAGFSSSSVRVSYTVTGTNQVAPETCAADQSRVCGPISRLTMKQDNKLVNVTYGNLGTGSAQLSKAPSEVTFHYTSSAEYAYKWMFMKFLNASSGVLTIIDAGDSTSSEACGAADAVGNGCLVQLNGMGSASFIVTFAGGADKKTVQYELAGPLYDSKIVTINFGDETLFAPVVVPATRVSIAGTAGMVKVTTTNANGKLVSVTMPGATAVRFTPTLAEQTFYFPRKKGSAKVSVVIGKLKKVATVRVS